ncbi:MAG TPA: hypothetical protein VJH03_07625 [Blastocatellia bacterium]|nr:hypothetical protein [Blastocatellia bacterium]
MASRASIYVLKQYLSTASRRELQWLSLDPDIGPVQIWHQAQGNRFAIHSPAIHTVAKWPNPTGILSRIGLHGLKRRLDQLYFPSPTILYVRRAVSALSKVIGRDLSEGRKVCLITPVPPHDLVLAGLRLKQRHPGIRWIIDWQDLWSYDESYFCQLPKWWRQPAVALERLVVKACDLNVSTNDHAGRVLVERCGASPDRVRAIPHAFETGLCEQFPPVQRTHAEQGRPPRIGFLGNLFKPPKVPGERVMAALEAVWTQGVAFEFHIYGDKYLERVCRTPLNGRPWAILHPMQSHEQILPAVAECDWLLLSLADNPNTRVTLHGKLPYYLALNKPIVALVPEDSAVADVIRETGVGFVFGDEQMWTRRLVEVLSDCGSAASALGRDEQAVARYSWHSISGLWLQALECQEAQAMRSRAAAVPG